MRPLLALSENVDLRTTPAIPIRTLAMITAGDRRGCLNAKPRIAGHASTSHAFGPQEEKISLWYDRAVEMEKGLVLCILSRSLSGGRAPCRSRTFPSCTQPTRTT